MFRCSVEDMKQAWALLSNVYLLKFNSNLASHMLILRTSHERLKSRSLKFMKLETQPYVVHCWLSLLIKGKSAWIIKNRTCLIALSAILFRVHALVNYSYAVREAHYSILELTDSDLVWWTMLLWDMLCHPLDPSFLMTPFLACWSGCNII